METYHTVVQGEYLSLIAYRYGFASFLTIWDHPENAEFKKKRQSPNVLLPGDRLYIPLKESKEENRPTDKRHRFQVKRDTLQLRLVVEELYNKPLANTKCELQVEGEVFELKTDSKGRLEKEIPVNAQSARLIIKEGETPLRNVPLTIKIGNLDPVSEQSGQVARLRNLGYYPAAERKIDERLLDSAVQQFQLHHGLKVDGICGPATRAKLKEVYGS